MVFFLTISSYCFLSIISINKFNNRSMKVLYALIVLGTTYLFWLAMPCNNKNIDFCFIFQYGLTWDAVEFMFFWQQDGLYFENSLKAFYWKKMDFYCHVVYSWKPMCSIILADYSELQTSCKGHKQAFKSLTTLSWWPNLKRNSNNLWKITFTKISKFHWQHVMVLCFLLSVIHIVTSYKALGV